MPLLKPATALWNHGHSLASKCIGFWPLCEGSGTTLADLEPTTPHNGAVSGAINTGYQWQSDPWGIISVNPQLLLSGNSLSGGFYDGDY